MEKIIVLAVSLIITVGGYFSRPAAVNKSPDTTEESITQAQQEQSEAVEVMKKTLTEGIPSSAANRTSITDVLGSPRAKYSPDTGDMEIWFYRDFYLVFDRELVSLKDYEVTIPK